MMILTKSELSKILGLAAPAQGGDISVNGVRFDSRTVEGGELFVALRGENTHGHQYVRAAFDNGASLALVEKVSLPEFQGLKTRLIEVKDSLSAFSQIAAWWRGNLTGPVLGVTGSVGKTTVKSLCAHILSRRGEGSYSVKSFNNHVGVPFTLCNTCRDAAWTVVEMGMNHPGELAALSQIVKPDVAVITGIAPVHMEFFESLEDVARAKLEILEGLPPRGTVVINGDDRVLKKTIAKWLGTNPGFLGKIKRFGFGEDADLRIVDPVSRGLEGISFNLAYGKEEHSVDMQLLGVHNAANAACAVLASLSVDAGLSFRESVSALSSFKAPEMRLDRFNLQGGRKLIDDSYNASPETMKALIRLGSDLKKSGLKVGLILGSMAELGENSEQYHSRIGKLVKSAGPDFLIAVGNIAEFYVEETKDADFFVYHTIDPLDGAQKASGLDFDVILVKGSRVVGLERTVSKLLELIGVEEE